MRESSEMREATLRLSEWSEASIDEMVAEHLIRIMERSEERAVNSERVSEEFDIASGKLKSRITERTLIDERREEGGEERAATSIQGEMRERSEAVASEMVCEESSTISDSESSAEHSYSGRLWKIVVSLLIFVGLQLLLFKVIKRIPNID